MASASTRTSRGSSRPGRMSSTTRIHGSGRAGALASRPAHGPADSRIRNGRVGGGYRMSLFYYPPDVSRLSFRRQYVRMRDRFAVRFLELEPFGSPARRSGSTLSTRGSSLGGRDEGGAIVWTVRGSVRRNVGRLSLHQPAAGISAEDTRPARALSARALRAAASNDAGSSHLQRVDYSGRAVRPRWSRST